MSHTIFDSELTLLIPSSSAMKHADTKMSVEKAKMAVVL